MRKIKIYTFVTILIIRAVSLLQFAKNKQAVGPIRLIIISTINRSIHFILLLKIFIIIKMKLILLLTFNRRTCNKKRKEGNVPSEYKFLVSFATRL